MGKLKEWKENIHSTLVAHEDFMTALLIGIAIVLVLVALFGKPHHKAMACLYIVL